MLNLNPCFLERKFDNENNRAYVNTLWNYLVPNKFYIYICTNDNFITLNKLSLKYQHAFDILNNFILEDNLRNIQLLKEYPKKNDLLYQYIYSTLFPKYFCRVDDYCVKSKLAFEVAHAGCQNQQQSLRFVQLPFKKEQTVKQEQTEIDEVVEGVEISTPLPKTTQKSKKRKIKNADAVTEKVLLKKKKREENKAKLLSDLHMKQTIYI